MAEATLEQKLELAQKRIEELEALVEQHVGTIKRQTQQISDLRSGLVADKDLPEEVIADAKDRMAAGIPKDIAIELAIHQHKHNKNLKAQAEAGKTAATASEKTTEKKPGNGKTA